MNKEFSVAGGDIGFAGEEEPQRIQQYERDLSGYTSVGVDGHDHTYGEVDCQDNPDVDRTHQAVDGLMLFEYLR